MKALGTFIVKSINYVWTNLLDFSTYSQCLSLICYQWKNFANAFVRQIFSTCKNVIQSKAYTYTLTRVDVIINDGERTSGLFNDKCLLPVVVWRGLNLFVLSHCIVVSLNDGERTSGRRLTLSDHSLLVTKCLLSIFAHFRSTQYLRIGCLRWRISSVFCFSDCSPWVSSFDSFS